MPTQAQEIDGHVLINDIDELNGTELKPGDLIEVEITDCNPQDLIGRAVKMIKPQPKISAKDFSFAGLKTELPAERSISNIARGARTH